jgi:hypothetical protein
MRVSHLFLFSLAALGLGACANDGITTVTQMSTAYDSDDYAHEASVKDIFVVVRGEAFGLSQQQLEQIVTQDMQGGGWGPNPHFTTVSGNNVGKMFSYVMVLNPSEGLTADAVCNNPSKIPAITQAPPSGVTRLLATMCRYDASMIGTNARAVDVTSPQDPRFRELIRTAMMELTTPLTRDGLLLHNDDGGGNSTTP